MKKKILVIGNYNDAIYHGLAGVDKRLASILSDYELICTDDTSKLLTLEKDHISGIISYLVSGNQSFVMTKLTLSSTS